MREPHTKRCGGWNLWNIKFCYKQIIELKMLFLSQQKCWIGSRKLECVTCYASNYSKPCKSIH